MADEEGALETDQNTKPWDPERLFQRVKSPSFELRDKPLDGDGHVRGTRRLTDYPLTFDKVDPTVEGALKDIPLIGILADFLGDASDALVNRIFEQASRMVPNWVRTLGPLLNGPGPEQAGEHEVYGQLLRSFQTWTDVPGFQWHRWYDWNLHIRPAKAYDWLRGEANRIPLKRDAKPGEPALSQFVDGSLECEWDMGSIGPKPGPMFSDVSAGRRSNWFWPMTGDFTWVVGRSIYDGGHEFSAKVPDPNDPVEKVDGPKLAFRASPGQSHRARSRRGDSACRCARCPGHTIRLLRQQARRLHRLRHLGPDQRRL